MKPIARSTFLTGLSASLLSACSQLTAFNTLTPKDPAQRVGQGIAYGGEARQKLDVYAPPGRPRSAPVMVFFYGGSWDSGRRQDYSFAGHALASLGFLTVVPDYRLYPEVRFPDFLDDCAQAVRWAKERSAELGGDPARLALCGHSAGAYNAVMLALDRALLAKAGVDAHAIKAVAGLSGPYNFLPLDVKATLQSFGGYPDLSATQPMAYARADAPPTFLAWGDADTLVGRKNIAALDAALRQAGVSVESKIYPGVDHPGTVLALSRPFRGKAPLLADLQAFFRNVSLL